MTYQTKLKKYTHYHLIKHAVDSYPDSIAQMYRVDKKSEYSKKTFSEMADQIKAISLGLMELGLKKSDKVGLIADVGHNWLPVCLGICSIGGVDVPRGTDATVDDLAYIFQHAECKYIFLENVLVFDKIQSQLAKFPGLKTIIFFEDPGSKTQSGIKILTLAQLIENGKSVSEGDRKYFEAAQLVEEEDLATIIYTSGTTGSPKGVMHTQKSLVWEIDTAISGINIGKNGVTMGFLPPWHIAERLIECVSWHTSTALAFTSVATLAKDLQDARPTFLLSVPRVWEGLYNKIMDGVKKASPVARFLFNTSKSIAYAWSIQKDVLLGRKYRLNPQNIILTFLQKIFALFALSFLLLPNQISQLILGKVRKVLGGRVKFAISGAGALPEHIDRFFYSAGIPILETYGMTETVGVTSRRDLPGCVVGTIGDTFEGVKIELRDEQGNVITKPNTKGIAWHWGPHIMKGYYKDAKKTDEVLKDGWLNSGDILIRTATGQFKFAGRAKDTIVLFGGENIEPQPIEDILSQNEFILQVVVVGQDKKTLSALIIPAKDALIAHFKTQGIELSEDMDTWNAHADVQKLYKKILKERISADTGFKNFEKVSNFTLLSKEFTLGVELTQTMKVKRNVVFEKYAKEIESMYN